MSANANETSSANVVDGDQLLSYLQNESNAGVPVQLVQSENESAIFLPSQAIELNGERHVIVSQAQDPDTGELLLVLQGENGEHIALSQEAFSSGLVQMASEDGGIVAVVTQASDSGLTLVTGDSSLVSSVLEADNSSVLSSLVSNIPSQSQPSTAPTNVVQAIETPRVTALEEQSSTKQKTVAADKAETTSNSIASDAKNESTQKKKGAEQRTKAEEKVGNEKDSTTTNTSSDDKKSATSADSLVNLGKETQKGKVEAAKSTEKVKESAKEKKSLPEKVSLDAADLSSGSAVIQVQDSGSNPLVANAMLPSSDGNFLIIDNGNEREQVASLPTGINLSDVINASSTTGLFLETPEGQLVPVRASDDGTIRIMPVSGNEAELSSATTNLVGGQLIQAISDGQAVAYTLTSNSGLEQSTASAKKTSRSRAVRQPAKPKNSPAVTSAGQTMLMPTTVTSSSTSTSITPTSVASSKRKTPTTSSVSNAKATNSGSPTKMQGTTKSAITSSNTSILGSMTSPSQLASSRRTYSKQSNIIWITPETNKATPSLTVTNSTTTSKNVLSTKSVGEKLAPAKHVKVSTELSKSPTKTTLKTSELNQKSPISVSATLPTNKLTKIVTPEANKQNLLQTRSTSKSEAKTKPDEKINQSEKESSKKVVEESTKQKTNQTNEITQKIETPTPTSRHKALEKEKSPKPIGITTTGKSPKTDKAKDEKTVENKNQKAETPAVRPATTEKIKESANEQTVESKETPKRRGSRRSSSTNESTDAFTLEISTRSSRSLRSTGKKNENDTKKHEDETIRSGEKTPTVSTKVQDVVKESTEKQTKIDETPKDVSQKLETKGENKTESESISRSSKRKVQFDIKESVDEKPESTKRVATPGRRGRPPKNLANKKDTPDEKKLKEDVKEKINETPKLRVSTRVRKEVIPNLTGRQDNQVKTESEAPKRKSILKETVKITGELPQEPKKRGRKRKVDKIETNLLIVKKSRFSIATGDPSKRLNQERICIVKSFPEAENDSPEKEELQRRKTISSLNDIRTPNESYDYASNACNFYIRHQTTSPLNTPKQGGGNYCCQKCGFRTGRLNNLVLHHKDQCTFVKNAVILQWQSDLQKAKAESNSISKVDSRTTRKSNEKTLKDFDEFESEEDDEEPSSSFLTHKKDNEVANNNQEQTPSVGDIDAMLMGSDEEDLLSIDIQKSKKEFGFADDDIVWVETRGMQWPALVIKVYSKEKKVMIEYIDGPWPKTRTKLDIAVVSLFDNAEVNKKNLDDGRKTAHGDLLVKAVQKSEEYLRKRCLGSNISATKFFESYSGGDHEDGDKLRNEDEKQKNKYSGLSKDNDNCVDVDSDGVNEKIRPPEAGETSEEAKRQETALAQWKERRKVQNAKLLQCIKDGKVETHLVGVFRETIFSSRHHKFRTGSESEKNQLKHVPWFGPIDDEEQQEEIYDYCSQLFKANFKTDGSFDTVAYIFEVWVPEAIVKAISRVRGLDIKEAESVFAKGVILSKSEKEELTKEIQKEAEKQAERATQMTSE